MMDIALLCIVYSLLFSLAAAAVKIHLSLLRGFDFSIAVAILAAAEVFIGVFGLVSADVAVRLFVATMVGMCSAFLIIFGWLHLLSRTSLKGDRRAPGTRVLVASLGMSIAASGAVGLIRGPGLRQLRLGVIEPFTIGTLRTSVPSLYMLVVGIGVVLTLTIWSYSKSGTEFSLVAQNAEFAEELGVRVWRLRTPAALISGLATGSVGCYMALSGGSTPTIGLPIFLYGTGSALLLSRPTFPAGLIGGAFLGTSYVCSQLFVSPAWSNAIVFGAMAAVLLKRGTSRTRQGLR